MRDLLERLTAALADRYAVECEIGRGGMATVYLAEDLKHRRKVAIKVLHPELTVTLIADRFLQEIKIAAGLNHPHILALFDSGEADEFLYYVMPYVEGESLRERLDREGQLPIPNALAIATEVTDGLSYAHRQGVVHRDIKPGNILLSRDHALIADFGVAQALNEAGVDRVTKTGIAVGSAVYMSPEQATGERALDGRSDLYSLGCVLYEMLAGEPPFTAGNAQAIVTKHAIEPAPRLSRIRSVPSGLERAILQCLAKVPDNRHDSADDLRECLVTCQAELSARRLGIGFTLRRPAVLTAIVTVGLAILAGGGWMWLHQSRAKWARTVALPEAAQLIDQGKLYPALRVLRQAEAYVPDDPVLDELLMESTTSVTVRTSPPGAQVYARDYLDEPEAWELLGSAPVNEVRLPSGLLVWKLSLPGFETQEELQFTSNRNIEFSLQPAGSVPPGMVHVPGGPHLLFSSADVMLEDYWIDRYEVTNGQFKEFVDDRGYEKRNYWTQPIVRDGETLTWEQARALFRDRTGRPGPATWELSSYPEGQDDYPVGGVSWYEAAAYCASVGKQLPTVYHWYHAADFSSRNRFVPLSNFSASGPAPVGHPLRMGTHGTYDMAGNVREWTWNQADGNTRYILGGDWSEYSTRAYAHDAQRPLDRAPTYGFRCARYRQPPPSSLLDPVQAPFRDYRTEKPVGDEVYAVYESLYRYDRVPADPRVESVDDHPENWRTERVSFASASGNERVPALLFLPENGAPPYQAVVYFPALGVFFAPRPFNVDEIESTWFLFLVRSGRAVLFPEYDGSFERHIGNVLLPNVRRDVIIRATKDLQRAVDYLESRPDIDGHRLAFFGLSSAAGLGPIMTAIERRFSASILLGAGLSPLLEPPEVDPLNFLPRVTVPTLMINGRHDFFYPLETSQQPMFHWLGTPLPDKQHRVFESSHVPTERAEVMKEILNWLDRYLGVASES